MKKTIVFVGLMLILIFSVTAQSGKKATEKNTKKTTAVVIQPINNEPTSPVETTAPVKVPPKRNERPEEPTPTQTPEPKKRNQKEIVIATTQEEKRNSPYIYEFSQPNFLIKHIVIEHDEDGKGTIKFEHKNYGEEITEPIQISKTALERINNLFETLNFLSSTEDYQSSKDFSHLGNHSITLRKNSQERTAKYNWTENKDAKALAGEYHKISEQFIWYFDMNLARENQRLEAPILVNKLDSLLKRNEISDPPQMLPYLKDLSNDERIPLLARNHVLRIIKDIEKNSAKKDSK